MEGNTRLLNINVGVLGHVDSGKTSLVKALSTSLSTAALDKNPQSQRRGITLDLGFSSFAMDLPEHIANEVGDQYDALQFTLVDCPGHASLIRTIIGGAQIIDMIVLVIDINKGIQTQTAECIVIGEITTDKMIVVLNKVDMIPEQDKESQIDKMIKKIRKVFSTTKFSDVEIILTSAAIGGEKVASVGAMTASAKSSKRGNSETTTAMATMGIPNLLEAIRNSISLPHRNFDGPFYYAIDHCFAIKGHGTVVTGTVLSGSVQVNTTIELPDLQVTRKVKSMQMFHKSVKSAKQGDRVGLCVTNLDPKLIERGIAVTPNSVTLLSTVICLVRKVRFFKQNCKSNSKFHVSIGHATVTATALFFGAQELEAELEKRKADLGDGSHVLGSTGQSTLNSSFNSNFPDIQFDWDADYEYQDELLGGARTVGNTVSYGQEPLQWMLLQFQTPVYCPLGSLVIASRLEVDPKDAFAGGSTTCRLAFYGPLKAALQPSTALERLRLYKWKSKECEIQRCIDVREDNMTYEAVGWKLYSKFAGIKNFLGLKLQTKEGKVVGAIHSSFGSSDKFKIRFPQGVKDLTAGSRLVLKFKRYVFDKEKGMSQRGIEFESDIKNCDSMTPTKTNEKMTATSSVSSRSGASLNSDQSKQACVSDKSTGSNEESKKPDNVQYVLDAMKQATMDEEEVEGGQCSRSSQPDEMYTLPVRNSSSGKDTHAPTNTTRRNDTPPSTNSPGGKLSPVDSIGGDSSRSSKSESLSTKPEPQASKKYSPLDLSTVGVKKSTSDKVSQMSTLSLVTRGNKVHQTAPAKSSTSTGIEKAPARERQQFRAPGLSVRVASRPAPVTSGSSTTLSYAKLASTSNDRSKVEQESQPPKLPQSKTSIQSASEAFVAAQLAAKFALKNHTGPGPDKTSPTTTIVPPLLKYTKSNIIDPQTIGHRQEQGHSSITLSTTRIGTIESLKVVPDSQSVVAIVHGAFSIEENIRQYVGSVATITTIKSHSLSGELTGPFAKMGKCKVRFDVMDGKPEEAVHVGSSVHIALSS
mmetsp:Transcript_6312/g.9528  ORF Transcript_6312/g.9528 Transcript_6312/m.9528 type:complete len:1035 (-) Transcript_6312:33-3137(-)